MNKILRIFLVVFIFFFHQAYSDTPDVLIEKGKLALFKNDFKNALNYLNKAISKDSFNYEAFYYRGLIYLYSNEFDKAIDDFSKTIELNKDFPDAYNNRGLAYSYLEQLSYALADFNRAIELDPKFAEAYMNRGSYYLAMEDNQNARRDLENAAKYNTSNPELYFLLGKLEYSDHNYQKSVDYFTKCISLGMNDAKIYFNRANAYVKLNQFQKAVDDYTKVIELNPDDIYSYNNRAFCYDKLGLSQKAESDYKKVQEIREKLFPKPVFGELVKVSDPDSTISFLLPNNWYYWFIKDSTKINILISKEYINTQSETLEIGAVGALIYNLSNELSDRSDENIIKFWEGTKEYLSGKFEIYEFKQRKSLRYKGSQAFENISRIQFKNTHQIFMMLEFAIIKNEKIFFINFQAPEEQFFLYEEMFQNIKNSIEVNFNKEVY